MAGWLASSLRRFAGFALRPPSKKQQLDQHFRNNFGVVHNRGADDTLLLQKTFSVVYSSAEQTRSFRSALLKRMRGKKKKEKNWLRQEAEAGGGGISVTLSIAFGSLFSLDVFGLSFSLYVFGLPCSMKIIHHRRRQREEAGSNVVQFTVIS